MVCVRHVVCVLVCAVREKSAPSTTPLALQDLLEKVILLKKAVEKERKLYSSAESGNVSKKLGEYSSLLASQGCVNTALSYLRQDADDQVRHVLTAMVMVICDKSWSVA